MPGHSQRANIRRFGVTTRSRNRQRGASARATLAGAAIALASVVTLITSLPAGAASGHEQIEGSGSSWAALAVQQWVSDESSSMQVVYTPSGSAQGRTDFANGQNDFAVSDIGYQGQNKQTGVNDSSNRPYAYLPIVGGATAFPYNIVVSGESGPEPTPFGPDSRQDFHRPDHELG